MGGEGHLDMMAVTLEFLAFLSSNVDAEQPSGAIAALSESA
jgi:hypothetical protein